MRRWCSIVVITLGLPASACGGDGAGGSADVPEGATFCSVFNDEFMETVRTASPTDLTAAETLVATSELLVQLAPGDLAAQAEANFEYFRDLAAGATPTDDAITGAFEFVDLAGRQC